MLATSPTSNVIPFKRTPKQKEVTKLLVAVRHAMVYGGARSGKTFIVLRLMAIRAMKCESRHLIVRYRFNHIKSAIVKDTFPKMMKLCFPGIRYKLNQTDWYVTFPNGSEIWFGGIDDKERVEKILGNEYATIYANECSQIGWDAIETLKTRLAQKTELRNKFWYDCNPPSKKHWTYKVFIQGLLPDGEPIKNKDAYGFIKVNPEDNLENLDEEFMDELDSMSKRQRQRFRDGEFLSDVEGALWDISMVDRARAMDISNEDLARVVVAVDPSVTDNPNSDECGIIVAGITGDGDPKDRKAKIIRDYSLKAKPEKWAQIAINAYEAFDAHAIVVETNQGGDLIETTLRALDFEGRIIKIHAKKNKQSRAEPVSALYEKGRVAHAEGLDKMESEQQEWVPNMGDASPNRLDAAVYAITELFGLTQKRRQRRVAVV